MGAEVDVRWSRPALLTACAWIRIQINSSLGSSRVDRE